MPNIQSLTKELLVLLRSGLQRITEFFLSAVRLSGNLLVKKQFLVAFGALLMFGGASAFQIAPMGSGFESKLTNESEASLARVAGKLGILIKGRVHEEITQLGMGCPIDSPDILVTDTSCGARDGPFASPYIIYGVRWNDLPPFRLSSDEGDCTYYGKSCNVSQTIHFFNTTCVLVLLVQGCREEGSGAVYRRLQQQEGHPTWQRHDPIAFR